MSPEPGRPQQAQPGKAAFLALRIIAAVAVTFVFLTSVQMLAAGFTMAGRGAVEGLLETARNPFVGLFCGILVTSVLQSSSVTTCMLVGLVSSDMLPIEIAIPVVMGANIGTTVTNTLVAMGHVTQRLEFRRAIACSTMHDFFNMMSVIILLPLELATGLLSKTAAALTGVFYGTGASVGKWPNPLKVAMKPIVQAAKTLCGHFPGGWGAVAMGLLAAVVLFVSLWILVRLLKSLMLGKVEGFLGKYLERHGPIGIGVGALVTAAVQSSSVTTSFFVPLSASGMLTIKQIYPMVLGANLGTTITALLAALAGSKAGMTLAFTHLLFNVCGILIFYPIPKLRLPIWLADKFGRLAARHRPLAIAYVVAAFYVIPLVLVFLSKWG